MDPVYVLATANTANDKFGQIFSSNRIMTGLITRPYQKAGFTVSNILGLTIEDPEVRRRPDDCVIDPRTHQRVLHFQLGEL